MPGIGHRPPSQRPRHGHRCLISIFGLAAVIRITLGLGCNRSVFYPYSSVGDTFTFDIVEDTVSNLTSNVSFIETLACVSQRTHLLGSPGN